MAIKNINTIQNPDDLAFIQEATKEYVLQSLANLGQRIGVAGDGVKISNFTFSDIVDGAEYASQDYVGYISESDGTVTLNILDKETLTPVGEGIVCTGTDNYIITTGTIELDTVINGIDGYAPSGKIIVDDNYYTVSFAGKTNGSTKEYICEKFHKTENIIDSALRITKYNGALHIFYLYIQDDGNYTLELYKEDEDNTRDLDTYVEYIQNMSVTDISPAYIVADATVDSFFANIAKWSDLTYNSSSNAFEFPAGADISGFKNIKSYVQFFAYDLTYLYRFIKKYYSEQVFKCDNLQFKRQIVANVFKMIIKNSTTATDAYIPLNFDFNYACNDADEWQIYYSTNDVIVKYAADTIDADYIQENSESSSIICATEKQDRTVLYNYSVDYDPENSTTIYNINVLKHFVLPYIDGDGYWVLNDVASNIFAKGKDAGNPNIIIVESHEDTYTIVSGANKDTLLTQMDWTRQAAYIQPLEKINIDSLKLETQYDWFKVNYWVPDIAAIPEQKEDEWLNLLDNSLIINIADLTCIDYSNNVDYTPEDVVARYGENGVITTMWVLNDTKTQYDYLRRQDNETCAADFNYITNMNNLINWSLENYEPKHPDKYQFTYVTFDASYVSLKNNEVETRTYIYPNIQNKPSGQYNTTNYNNDFNFIVKYNDIVEDGLNNNIETIQQTATLKYFDTSYNKGTSTANNVVTNSLYSYTVGKSKKKYTEYVPNYNVPSVDLGEVLTRNETLLNRLNVLSFDKYGTAYYSYIGTSYAGDKSIFTLGTSDTNINMGTETMIDAKSRNTFIPQTEVDINFDTTKVAGNAYVQKDAVVYGNTISYGINWTRYDEQISDTNVVTYWTTSMVPTGRYIYEIKDTMPDYVPDETISYTGIVNLNRATVEDTHIQFLTNEYVYKYAKLYNKLYTIDTVPERYKDSSGNYKGIHSIYIGDGLYIPVILSKLGLPISIEDNVLSLDNYVISSNMKIYTYNDTPVVLQSSSTMLYPDKYNYITVTKEDGSNVYGEEITDYTYKTFKGKELNITYSYINSKYYVTIDECQVCNNMSYVNKITTDYKI